jgi:hypothetical protein
MRPPAALRCAAESVEKLPQHVGKRDLARVGCGARRACTSSATICLRLISRPRHNPQSSQASGSVQAVLPGGWPGSAVGSLFSTGPAG